MMKKLKCSLSDKQLAKKCDDWIRSLIDTGGKSWCLNIPARPNEDPDLVFSELVRRFRGKDGVKSISFRDYKESVDFIAENKKVDEHNVEELKLCQQIIDQFELENL